MRTKHIYLAVAGVAALFVIGSVAAVTSLAKPTPEGTAGADITPENIAEQQEKLNEIEPAELQDEMVLDAAGEQIINYHDNDNNFYSYDANGKLLGITKFMNAEAGSLPELSEEELRETAQAYFEGLTDKPERYTQVEFDMNGEWVYAAWMSSCCGYPTTDITSVQVYYDGTLKGYFQRHSGDFDDVTVTREQVEAAIEDAVKQAFPDGENDKCRLKSVDKPEDVLLTHDNSGNLQIEVNLMQEVLEDDGYLEPYWMPLMGQSYYIPIA